MEAHISSVQAVDKYEERLHSDPLLEHICDQGALDPQYTAVVQAIQQKQTKNWVLNTSDNPCREYASVWERLGTLDTRDPTLLTLDIKRLVIPIQARKKILEVLHYSHQGINKTYAAARTRYFWPSMKEDCQQLTQSCQICKELNPKTPINPNIDPVTPITSLQPFESVGLDMFTWKNVNYLLVVDRMSGYIFVETLNKNAKCKTVTEKFKLLCITYGFPREVRFDKGPQFSFEFEEFLKEIHINPTPSSANNPRSNGLAEAGVRNAKILLQKSLEEKSSYAEVLQYFNQAPRSDGYSPSELFHGRRVRSHLPTIDETVDVDKGKAHRELTDMVTKNSTRTHKPVRALHLGDLVYCRHFDGKKTLRIDSLCNIIEVRNHGESYYIKDLNTDRIYLRNRSWIEPSETSLNEIHQAKNLEVEFDENINHSIIEVRNHGESYYIKDLNTDRIYLRNRSWIEPSETSLNEIHQAKNLKVKFDENISHSLVEGKVHSTNRKASTSCL